ncbi:non-ribosomal peptide synthetase [Nannocystaceae bacterium ST9]
MAFTLHELLDRAALARPDASALVLGPRSMSYAELARRANAIAATLRELGVRRGDRVAIYMQRSFDSVAAMFGIMQAGAAYVPFDSSEPAARLASIVDDCELDHAIVDEAHHAALVALLELGTRRLRVIGGPSGHASVEPTPWSAVDALERAGVETVDAAVIEQDPSVLFFTSGTTGKPKGVPHDHRSMLSNVEWALATFDLRSSDRFAHVTSHHFDLSWFELFVSMALAATLVLVPERLVGFPAELAALIGEARISVWCSVPAVLIGLVQRGELERRSLPELRRVHFAGERFPTKHLRALMQRVGHARYVNMFGTTETHIAAYHEIADVDALPPGDEWLPIGRRCSHVNLMAIDGQGRPVELGGTGELVIRGPSMMQGYWRLPERTASAVVELAVDAARPEGLRGRWYRSGDLVERLPGDRFRIIGRADRRAKVRGYLVDLDEVEKVLLQHPAVLEAATHVVGEAEAEARVEGAVRLRPGEHESPAALRLHVAQTLPSYAVPELIAVLDDFPRTGSGKFSRRKLVEVVAELRRQRREVGDDQDPRAALHGFLRQLIPATMDGASLTDGSRLVDEGWIDSMDVAELVAFIEGRFGVRISNDDFVVDNFATIDAMVQMIARLERLAGR